MGKRVLFPMAEYSANKDLIKKPFKALGLKWRFLGQDGETTKGQYASDDVKVFVQYTSEHADFSLTGPDEELQAILEAWAPFETEMPDEDEAPPSVEDEALAKELSVWRFKKPVQRPGEPEAFFERRLDEWKDADPRK